MLYEDNVLGKIPNEAFRKLSDSYLGDYAEESDIAEPAYDFAMIRNGELIAV